MLHRILEVCVSVHGSMVLQQHGFFNQHCLISGWARQKAKIIPLFATTT